MSKKTRIAKQLLKLAKELVAGKSIKADLQNNMQEVFQAMQAFDDTSAGNTELHSYIKKIVDNLIVARNGMASYYDAFLARKAEEAQSLHDMFYQQLAQGYREQGSGKKKKTITVNDINDLSKQSLSIYRNILGFDLVQPGMFQSLGQDQTMKPLNEDVYMPSLMQNPNDPNDIIQNPAKQVAGTTFKNLPFKLLISTGAVGAFDLFISRMSRGINPSDIDNKFKYVECQAIENVGAKLFIALGKQPTLLKDYMKNAVQKSILNKLLQGKSEIELPMNTSLRSLHGIIVNENQQIVLYDTSVSLLLAEMAQTTEAQQALIEEKRQKQIENPSLLRKQREMPENVLKDDAIRNERGDNGDANGDDGLVMSSRECRVRALVASSRLYEARCREAGIAEWWEGFKKKAKGLWEKTKQIFSKLAEEVKNCTSHFTSSSNKIKEAVSECEQADQKVTDAYAMQAQAFNEFIASLEAECDRVIAENK